MGDEHRTQAREQVELPMKMNSGAWGVTQDISATGLFFLTDSAQRVGGLIEVEIALDTLSGPMRLKAQGQIVRIESRGERTGVGVKVLSSRLEPVTA